VRADATNRATAAPADGGRPDLARLALEAGYADQAHLTRECSRLAGLPPAALLASGAGPAGERSVSFNTDRAGAATMAA
jgi:AraC-like DNA-binding protein